PPAQLAQRAPGSYTRRIRGRARLARSTGVSNRRGAGAAWRHVLCVSWQDFAARRIQRLAVNPHREMAPLGNDRLQTDHRKDSEALSRRDRCENPCERQGLGRMTSAAKIVDMEELGRRI